MCDSLRGSAGECAGRELFVLQQVLWFGLLQAAESTVKCYSLAAMSLFPCWCKWGKKNCPEGDKFFHVFCQRGEFLDYAEPVFSCLVPSVSVGSMFGMHFSVLLVGIIASKIQL